LTKYAVLYHCHPINNGLWHLEYFLKHGFHPDVHFYIACVDFEPPDDLANIKFFQVENDSHDFGGFARLLLEHVPVANYEYFGFFNSSCLGPASVSNSKRMWLEYFSDRLVNNIGICGATINCLGSKSPYFHYLEKLLDPSVTHYHVQTYAYMLSQSAVNLLLRKKFYAYPTKWTKEETIVNYEIGLSKMLLREGFQLSCLLKAYANLDYSQRTPETESLELIGDPCFINTSGGATIDAREVLFIKPSRGFKL